VKSVNYIGIILIFFFNEKLILLNSIKKSNVSIIIYNCYGIISCHYDIIIKYLFDILYKLFRTKYNESSWALTRRAHILPTIPHIAKILPLIISRNEQDSKINDQITNNII